MTTLQAAWRALDAARHRSELYRMWALGASAGFTTADILERIGPREDVDVEASRRWLLDGSRRGTSLGDLVKSPSARLSPIEAGLLALGDEGGGLDDVLRLLAVHHERLQHSMLALRKQLAYPLFTGLAATVIAPIPLIVRGHTGAYLLVVALAGLGWVVAGGAVVQGAAARFARTPALVRARLARTLATAMEAGLSQDRAVRLAAGAAADPAVASFVARIDPHRLATESLAETLRGCPGLTPDFRAVLANAELTGDYAHTLARLADLYEDGFR